MFDSRKGCGVSAESPGARDKTELLAGQKELVDIAKNCGFAHQSHFTSRFKQATGLTPTRWRRSAQEAQRQQEG